MWVEATQNDVVGLLAVDVSRKACAQIQLRKSWFENKLNETLFELKIVRYELKVSKCSTSIRNEKTYGYISIDNI